MTTTATGARYVGRCDQLRAEHLSDYDDSERVITAATFKRHLGVEAYRDLEIKLGYRSPSGRIECPDLKLASDYAVSFGKGRWRGKPCVCCHWSAYHHIWLIPS
jgi:hypothetical protein